MFVECHYTGSFYNVQYSINGYLSFSEYPDYELDKIYQEGYIVRQGGVVMLSVPIKGKPLPTCKWTKEGRDISHRAMIATGEERTELVIKDAHRDDTGTYDLVLENKCGKKAVYINVKVIGRPDAPEGPLEFDDIQARSVRVSWRPPSNDGGSDILGYIVERREVPKAAWYTVDSRVLDTSLVVKGLKENVEYHFRVYAENQFGVSRSLKSDESVTPKTPLSKYLASLICRIVSPQNLLNEFHSPLFFLFQHKRSTRTSLQSSRGHGCH